MLFAVFLTVVIVTAVHLASGGGSQGCSFPAPVPTLTPQLSALGGFDQPYDASDVATLESLATQAGGVVAHNLVGATPSQPVTVASEDNAKPGALIVPLLYAPTSTNAGRVAGLVVFLRDCAGRVYYSAVADLTGQSRPAAAFPSVPEATAAGSLQTSSPQLVYTADPAAPLWRNPATGATIPAFAMAPA